MANISEMFHFLFSGSIDVSLIYTQMNPSKYIKKNL